MHAAAPVPAPAAQEKQFGYKQVAALLSPAPLPAEKHRELATTPISVPIHATPSPTPTQVEEEVEVEWEERERLEPAAAAGEVAETTPNGADALSVLSEEQVDVPETETDDMSQVHEDTTSETESAPPPPTPEKDDASGSGRTAVLEPAAPASESKTTSVVAVM